jgi:hypothetical protein
MIPQSYPLYAAAVFGRSNIVYGLVVGWQEEADDQLAPAILWDGDEKAQTSLQLDALRLFVHPDRNYLHGQANAFASHL